MTNPFSTIGILEAIDSLMQDARRKGERIVQLRLGPDLKEEFEQSAGADFADGLFRQIPVSFDAIDPDTVLSETEPA